MGRKDPTLPVRTRPVDDDKPSPEYVAMRLKGIERELSHEYICLEYDHKIVDTTASKLTRRYWLRNIREANKRIDALLAERARLTKSD
jgi:hypothetical protein